jgi:hypothetical protein
MCDDLRHLNDLDRLIHEPARLMVVTILLTIKCADFLSAHLSRLEEPGQVKIKKNVQRQAPANNL